MAAICFHSDLIYVNREIHCLKVNIKHIEGTRNQDSDQLMLKGNSSSLDKNEAHDVL